MAKKSPDDELEALRRRNAELERRLLDFDPELADIFKNVQDLFYRADTDGRLVVVSSSIFNILGYRPHEVTGWQVADVYVDPADRSRLLAAIEQGGGRVTGFEVQLKRKDGEIVWVSANSQYYRDAEGNIAGVEGTIRDITSRKLAEEKYRRVLATSLDGFWMVDSGTLAILEVNERYCKMSGYSREELIKMTIPMLEGQQSEKDVRANVERIAHDGKARFESKHRKKNGELMDVEISVQYLPDHGLISVFIRDITEQNRAKVERDASEHKYRSLFESSPDAKIMGDVERGFVDCNRMTLQMFGCRDKNEFLRCQPEDFSPPQQPDGRASKQAAAEEIAKAMANGTNSFEWIHKRTSGELFPAEVLLTPISLGDRRMFQATVRDISDRKRAEAERDESERKYRELVKEAATIILRWDTYGNVTFFNEYAQQFFGFREEEIVGHNVVGTIVPETEFTGRDLAKLMQSIQADPASFEYNENENVRKNGERVWVAWRNRPYFDNDGKLTEILSVGIDMTARKQADEAILLAHDELERRVDARTCELAKVANEHATITNAVPDILFRFDRSGKLIWWNQALEAVTSLSGDQLLNRPIPDFVIESDIELAQQGFADTIRNGKAEIEITIHTAAGPRLYNIKGAVFIDESGEQNGTVGIGRDISEQREADNALSALLAEHQLIADSIQDVLFRVNDKAELLWWNRALQDAVGLPAHKLMMIPSLDLIFGEDREQTAVAIAGVFDHGEAEVEARMNTVDGPRYYAFNGSRLQDADGNVIGIVGAGRDMSAHKKAEEERKLLEAQLFQAQKLESLGILAGGIAHDFNNVLGGISINNYLLAREVEGEKARYLIERNEQLVDYSKRMVRQLLLFSDQRRKELQTFSLTRLLQESMHMVRLSLGEKVYLDIQVAEGSLPIHGDAGQVQQILLNLVNNARDAIADGAVPKITLKLEIYSPSQTFRKRHPEATAESYARISVKDNGSGISKEDLAHVFDPFFSTKEVGKGSGLGLAMVYGTVQAHEGVVDIASTPGRGTTVSIYLPLCSGDDRIDDSGVRHVASKGHGELILLADDDKHLRLASKEALEYLGYRVLAAVNGQEAVDTFCKHQDEVALVILDVVMPVLGGVDAAHRIREHAREVPIIFVTGHDMKQALDPEKRPKDSLIRSKPFDMVMLSQDIRKMVSERTV